jgi:hypothetical protein
MGSFNTTSEGWIALLLLGALLLVVRTAVNRRKSQDRHGLDL